VLVPITHVFIPTGFDSNDHAEIVVEGYLPNLCYQNPRYKIEKRKKNIKVLVYATKPSSAIFCPEVIVPFNLTVSLGVLSKGTYQIKGNKRSFMGAKKIIIEEAFSKEIDNYMYANVENITLREGVLTLRGTNYTDCLKFDKIQIISNKKDVYAILPKVFLYKKKCNYNEEPFVYRINFHQKLFNDGTLFHVRVMGGKSINKII